MILAMLFRVPFKFSLIQVPKNYNYKQKSHEFSYLLSHFLLEDFWNENFASIFEKSGFES